MKKRRGPRIEEKILHEFKIHCDLQMPFRKKGLWWHVIIVKDRGVVTRLYYRGRKRQASWPRVCAFVRCNDDGKPDKHGCLGRMVIPAGKGTFGASLAAHECGHCALFFCRYQRYGHAFIVPRKSLATGGGVHDERLCYALGSAVWELTRELHKCGMWK